MQQETPQVNPPAPQVPPVSAPPTPPTPPVQGGQGAAFYVPPATASAPTYNDHTDLPPALSPAAGTTPSVVTWEASEYVHIDKGALWMTGFIIIVVIALGISIWLSAWTFVVLILVMAVAMGVFAFRPPRVMRYTVNEDGIIIGDRLYHYGDYRAFGVLEDGAFFTMSFIPIKRFAPALSIYFSEEQGEQIVDTVGEHLPMQPIEPDLIDDIMRRLHF